LTFGSLFVDLRRRFVIAAHFEAFGFREKVLVNRKTMQNSFPLRSSFTPQHSSTLHRVKLLNKLRVVPIKCWHLSSSGNSFMSMS
jgi:hypothetical protein